MLISKVNDVSCNELRNDLLNNYIIDKFVVTKNGFVCIRTLGGHSFLWHGNPIFNCILCSVKFGINIFTRCSLCQDTISTYKLSIYVKNLWTKFHEIQGPVTYFFNLMSTHGPNSSKFKKNTIIMFQCKTYFNTC